MLNNRYRLRREPVAGNEGLLTPEDCAVLCLGSNDEGCYYAQNVIGSFRIVDGAVTADYHSEWRAEVEAKTEAEFVEMIKAALQ